MWQELSDCLVLSERCVVSGWMSLRATPVEMLLTSGSGSPKGSWLGTCCATAPTMEMVY